MVPTLDVMDGEATLANPPIYLADLGRCTPASAISSTPTDDAWHCYTYESDKIAGEILSVGEVTDAPDVTYPLAVDGLHAVWIGIYNDRYYGDMSVQVKLSGDPGFTILTLRESPMDFIYDVFWKVADLSGQTLTFAQVKSRFYQGWRVDPIATRTRIAYIKLVPLTPDEAADFERDRADPSHKRLFAHQDGGLLAAMMRDFSAAEVHREIEPYRDTDFRRMYWEAGFGDTLLYPSKIGRTPAFEHVERFPTVGEGRSARNWRRMLAEGLDTFAIAAEACHAIGMEFHACYRPAGFYFPPPQEYFNVGSFYEQHLDLRALAKTGAPVSRISYAFPETRRYVLSLVDEMATSYPIDGICILYNRAPPLTGWDPPLVESFVAQYGRDPRDLADDNPDWLNHKASVLSAFMRELRAELDRLAEQRGRDKRYEISAIVMGLPADNRLHGMDVEGWIREGTVDTLIPYTVAPDMTSCAISWPDVGDIDYWVNVVRGTNVTLAPDILPRWMTPGDYRRKAAELYEAGVENLFFWDSYGRVNYMDQFAWNALRQLGHREAVQDWVRRPHTAYHTSWVPPEDTAKVADWLNAGMPPLGPTSVVLRKLADWDLATGTPG